MNAFCVGYTSCLWLPCFVHLAGPSVLFARRRSAALLYRRFSYPKTYYFILLFLLTDRPTWERSYLYRTCCYNIIYRPSTAAAAAVHQLCNKTAMHTHYYVYVQRLCVFVLCFFYLFFFLSHSSVYQANAFWKWFVFVTIWILWRASFKMTLTRRKVMPINLSSETRSVCVGTPRRRREVFIRQQY